MKTVIKQIMLCLACFAAVLAVCFGLLCAAAAVPDSALEANLRKSAESLAAKEPHGETVKGIYHSRQDNYADAVLLGVAANMSAEQPVRSAVDTKYYDDGFGPALGILATLSGYDADVDYTRYWHGSLTVARPLLAVTDIAGIRLAGSAAVLLLLGLDVFLLLRMRQRAACVLLCVSAVLTEFWFVFTSLEYMPVYIIMLAAVPVYARFAENSRALTVISAGVGTLTAFADFLTAETLTILVPLTVAFFVTASKGEKPDSKKSLKTAAGCIGSWGCCYLMTFAVKWLTASVMLGRNVSETAMAAALKRVNSLEEEITSPAELFFSSLGANFTALTPSSERISGWAVVWAAVFAAVCFAVSRTSRRSRSLPAVTMIVIAALPVVRFCLLMNHSYLHSFFTYRALMSTIMALMGLMYYRVGSQTKKK